MRKIEEIKFAYSLSCAKLYTISSIDDFAPRTIVVLLPSARKSLFHGLGRYTAVCVHVCVDIHMSRVDTVIH